MTVTHLFLGLLAAGFLLMLAIVLIDDIFGILFDGAAPVISVALATAGTTGIVATSNANLGVWPAAALAAAVAAGAGTATWAAWRAVRRHVARILTPLEPAELLAVTGSVLWWRDGRGKVLLEAPRGGQYQLVASSDEHLHTGQSVTVIDAEPDEYGSICVVVSSLTLPRP